MSLFNSVWLYVVGFCLFFDPLNHVRITSNTLQMTTLKFPENDLSRLRNCYAHIEIVVTFSVVNFFGFLVITRHHGSFEGRH